ncbi:MAG: hypothetical protein FIA95_16500 [Gemmatimonadetes bacterium]|nr:hypothetical protein [Gemmatimonadota bacterium]
MALTGQFVYLDVIYWDFTGLAVLSGNVLHPALRSSVLTGAVVPLVVAAAALMLAFRADGDRGAHPFGLALAAWGYLLAYSGLTILLAPDSGSAARPLFDAHFLFVEALALAALLRFTALFPTPLLPGALRDPDTIPPLIRPAQHVRAWLLTPSGPWVAGSGAFLLVLASNAAMGRPTQDAPLIVLADIFRLGALAGVVLNLRAGFGVADTTGRRAGFWFVVGFTLLLGAVGALLGGNVLTAVTEWSIPGFNWRPVVLDLGVLGLIWGAVMGIAYRGARKPGPLARRAALLATTVTAALFLAAGLESLFTGVVASPVTLPRGSGTVLAFLAMGILYTRIRRPLESLAYRAWADAPADDGER